MTLADWVKLLNLLGSVVLFYASYRNQRWLKKQAVIENRAVLHARPPEATEVPEVPARQPTQAQFDRAAAENVARPYFDRLAYQLLCVGFAITAVVALVDLYQTGALTRLLGF